MRMKKFSDDWYRAEWMKLGFYYDLDHDAKHWNINGSRAGLLAFVAVLREYASAAENDWVSCHSNHGPHDYLEIGTWDSAVIDGHWIAGRLNDLLALVTYIEEWVFGSRVGESLAIRSFFSPGSSYDLLVTVEVDGFDPSSLDTSLAAVGDGRL